MKFYEHKDLICLTRASHGWHNYPSRFRRPPYLLRLWHRLCLGWLLQQTTEESAFSSVIDLLNTAAFLFVGAWMPFDLFSDETLSLSVKRLVCISVLVLSLRRLPVIFGLFKWMLDIKSFHEVLFRGHFGPIGVGES
jgi:NhaP-type Na+/H+ or K+/H+ antiporter